MPASRALSAHFRDSSASALHHNHPLFLAPAKLCFESGQQSLAAGGISDYHLSRNFISAPRAYSANSPLDYPLKQ